MLGLFGLMAVLLASISLASYWISWDLQHKEDRSSFATKVRHDFADLVGKCRPLVRNGEWWRAALDAYAKKKPAKWIDSVLQRRDPS